MQKPVTTLALQRCLWSLVTAVALASCFDSIDQFEPITPGDANQPDAPGDSADANHPDVPADGGAVDQAVPASCAGCVVGVRCSSSNGEQVATSCREGACTTEVTSCNGNGCQADRCNRCRPGTAICTGDRLDSCRADGSGFDSAPCPGNRRCETTSCSDRCIDGFLECGGVCERGSCCAPPGGKRCAEDRCVGPGQCCKACTGGCFDESCVVNVAFDGWRDVRDDGTDYGNTMNLTFSGDRSILVTYVAGPQQGQTRALIYTSPSQLKYVDFPNTGIIENDRLINWGAGTGTWRR